MMHGCGRPMFAARRQAMNWSRSPNFSTSTTKATTKTAAEMPTASTTLSKIKTTILETTKSYIPVVTKEKVTKVLKSHIIPYAVGSAAVVVVTTFGVGFTYCIGPSMIPTVDERGEFVFVNLWPWQEFKRGDIVISKSKVDPEKQVCKRIVAMGGDEVIVMNAQIKRDLLALDTIDPLELEIKLFDLVEAHTLSEITLAENEVFLAGDNPSNSMDSRHYGPVPQELLFGTCFMKIYDRKKNKLFAEMDHSTFTEPSDVGVVPYDYLVKIIPKFREEKPIYEHLSHKLAMREWRRRQEEYERLWQQQQQQEEEQRQQQQQQLLLEEKNQGLDIVTFQQPQHQPQQQQQQVHVQVNVAEGKHSMDQFAQAIVSDHVKQYNPVEGTGTISRQQQEQQQQASGAVLMANKSVQLFKVLDEKNNDEQTATTTAITKPKKRRPVVVFLDQPKHIPRLNFFSGFN